MPQKSTWKLHGKLAVAVLSISMAACSSLQRPSPGSTFADSASDFVNRAPQSLSIPKQTPETDQSIDPMYLRTQSDYHFALAESYSLEGSRARAIEEYKLTLLYDPTSSIVRLRLASEYLRQGLTSEALRETQAVLEAEAANPEAHMQMGTIYSNLRMYDEAIEHFQKVVTLSPDNFEATMLIGAVYAEQGKYKQAIPVFQKLAANSENPNVYLASFYLGRVHFQNEADPNCLKNAEAALKQSREAKPAYSESAMALGQVYEKQDRKNEAVDLYANFQEYYGPSAGVAEALSKLYIERKDYDRALVQLRVIEDSDNEDLNAKVKIALIHIEKKQFKPAIAKLHEILKQTPNADRVRFYLAAVYEEIQDNDNAIEHFLQVVPSSPYFKESVTHAAFLLRNQKRYDEAKQALAAGLKVDDSHTPFYTLQAAILEEQKQLSAAAKMMQAAVKKNPTDAQAYFYLGSLLDRSGEREDGIVAMTTAIELDPKHAQALNYLAYTYAELDKDLDVAEMYAESANKLQPNDGYILDTLGFVQLKKGKVDQAIKTLELASKHQPHEIIIVEHLGDAYYRKQMVSKAREQYERAMELAKNAPDKNDGRVVDIRDKIAAIDKRNEVIETIVGTPQKPAGPKNSPDTRMPASER